MSPCVYSGRKNLEPRYKQSWGSAGIKAAHRVGVYVTEHRPPSVKDCGAKIVGTLGDNGNNSEKKEDLRKACVMGVQTLQ